MYVCVWLCVCEFICLAYFSMEKKTEQKKTMEKLIVGLNTVESPHPQWSREIPSVSSPSRASWLPLAPSDFSSPGAPQWASRWVWTRLRCGGLGQWGDHEDFMGIHGTFVISWRNQKMCLRISGDTTNTDIWVCLNMGIPPKLHQVTAI